MSPVEARSVHELGFEQRTCQFLRSSGVTSLGALLDMDPEVLGIRSRLCQDVEQTLSRHAQRFPEGAARIEGFLDALRTAVAAREAQTEEPVELSTLPAQARNVFLELNSVAHPMLLRELRGRTGTSGAALREHDAFVLYPYGLHRWVGLTRWGVEGYRKAVRASWNVLPLHLQRLEPKELDTIAWEAVRDVALERRDQDLLASAAEALLGPVTDERPVTRVAEATATPRYPVRAPAPEPPAIEAEQVEEAEPPRPSTLAPVVEPAPVVAEAEQIIREAWLRTKPRIFLGVSAKEHYVDALRAIVAAADRVEIPFSLAELDPSLGDFKWLQAWARDLSALVARTWVTSTHRRWEIGGQSWSCQECLGVLLLYLAAETARRGAREGHVWSVVPPCFSSGAREELFAGGQPRAATRESIEAGARKLGVRHAFGQEATMAWYLTIYLQFGFTRQGIQALPIWLSSLEHATESVSRLYHESPDFQRGWNALRQFRRGQLDKASTLVSLKRCPFILEPWWEEVLVAAQGRADIKGLAHEPQEGLPLFGQPRLRWSPPEKPYFELCFEGLNAQGLTDTGYDVIAGCELAGRVLLNVDGSYSSEPERLKLPLNTPYVTVLLEGNEEDEQEFDLVLWSSDDEVMVFDGETGVRLSLEDKHSVRRPLLLWLKKGLGLSPTVTQVQHLPEGHGTLHLLSAGWSPETCVMAQGEELVPLLADREPAWLSKVELSIPSNQTFCLGDRVPLFLSGLPEGAEVVSARFAGQALEFSRDGLGWESVASLPTSLSGGTLRIRFTVEQGGRRTRFGLSARVSVFGASICVPEEGLWKPMDRIPRLSAQQLRNAQVRFFLGEEEREHWGLLEGHLFSQRPPRRAARLAPLKGYGAGFELRRGPYNSVEPGTVLVREVVDHGLLERVERTPGGELELTLRRPLEAGLDHFLLFWGSAGELATVPADDWRQTKGLVWAGEAPEEVLAPMMVSLGYEDTWQGTVWEPGFTPPWNGEPAVRTAGLLRWLHLPLLTRSWRDSAKELLARAPTDCMAAWLFDRQVQQAPGRLTFDEREEWLAVVRVLFENYPMTESTAFELWNFLLSHKDGEVKDSDLLLQLLTRTPIFGLKLCRECSMIGSDLYSELCENIVGFSPGDRSFRRALEELECEAARDLKGADPVFTRTLCQRVLKNRPTEVDKRNLRVACQRPIFSRLLAVHFMLDWLGQA